MKNRSDRSPATVRPLDRVLETVLTLRGLSVRDAAVKLGVSHTCVEHWIRRRRVPHRFYVPVLATFLRASEPAVTAMRAEMSRLKRHERRVGVANHG